MSLLRTKPKTETEQVWEASETTTKLLELRYEQLAEKARARLITYYNDPVAWADECIAWPAGQSLTPYQREVLAAIPVHARVAQRGPHGLGKSTTSAIAVLWFVTTREAAQVDWKCITTAGGWHQLEHYLWPEIHKWAKLIRWERLGRDAFNPRTELLKLNLNLRYGSAFAVASTDPARIEGAHADSIFYIYDESKVITDQTFDAAEGAFSGAGREGREAFALASSTPGEPMGRFYDIHQHKIGFEDWWTKHVTLWEAIRAGRVSPKWAKQRKRQWGKNSQLYANRVLGDFHSSDEDAVIPLSWIEAAVQRWHDNSHLPHARMDRIGADIAGAGEGDKTVIAPIYGLRVGRLQYVTHEDTEQIADRIRGIVMSNPGVEVVVDADGLGVGVYDKLNHAEGVAVSPFHAGAKTDKKDKSGELTFLNTRSAAWWSMREMLDPLEGSTIELPDDDLLVGDLSAPKWFDRQARGIIQVESKDDIKKRIGRSTDSGDAVMMGFWRPRKKRKARMTFAGPAR